MQNKKPVELTEEQLDTIIEALGWADAFCHPDARKEFQSLKEYLCNV